MALTTWQIGLERGPQPETRSFQEEIAKVHATVDKIWPGFIRAMSHSRRRMGFLDPLLFFYTFVAWLLAQHPELSISAQAESFFYGIKSARHVEFYRQEWRLEHEQKNR